MARVSLPEEADASTGTLSQESLQRHNRLLYEIVSQTGRGISAQVRHALERTAGLLGLDYGLLARVEEHRYVVEECHDPSARFETGQVFDLGDTYCAMALEENGLVAFSHADDSDVRGQRCYDVFAFESYIGVPVHAEDQVRGTLAFGGNAPKPSPFTEADRSLVRLLGQWASLLLERRASERSRRQTERWLHLLAENVSDMVCLHDLRGHCIYVSPSCERLLGYAPEDLVGTSAIDYAHPDDYDRIRDATARALRGEPDVVERSRLRHADGSYRWCETAGHPVYADDGETIMHVLSSTRDVTPRVEAEQDLERTNAELRLRNRELKDFAHIASHDLQEPLRKVRAFADLMLEDYADAVDEDGHYYLERMQDGAARMSRLVSDLLSLSRITTQGHPFETVDLAEIAAVVRTDLEMRIEETGGRVEIGDLPSIEADPTQMRQLLQNLVGNALRFHRAGVPPVVEVRGGLATPEERAAHADDLAGDAPEVYRLVVEDNGIGFEEKFLDRIFTPLQRLHGHDQYEGTGIGLAVCRRIAERHGGAIWAESRAGAGSCFTVLLPEAQPTAPPGDAGRSASSPEAVSFRA